ncbi:MAG: CBS domain-containing protein, partial [Pseudomonadota bacterium]
MKMVKNIMSTEIISIDNRASLFDARQLMAKHEIRHLPVIDIENQEFIGLVTQRSAIHEYIQLVNGYGVEQLEKKEKRMPVTTAMIDEVDTVCTEEPLEKVGGYF